jgi:hypothetical protein
MKLRALPLLLSATLALLPACSDSNAGSGVLPTWLGGGPTTWHHPLGVTLEVPAGWETVATSGSSAFLPPDGRREDGSYRAVGSFIFLPSGDIRSVEQGELVATADREIGAMAAQVQRVGPPERFDVAGHACLALRYDTQDTEIVGHVDLYVTLNDGLALGLLVAGDREPVTRYRQEMFAIMQSLRFEEPARESSLEGRWSRSESYVSGEFSMASESSLELAANGRYARRSESAGGDLSNTFDTGSGAEQGTWFADGGMLVLRSDAGPLSAYRYTLGSGSLTITDESGSQTLRN